jgi:hypothetical protein
MSHIPVNHPLRPLYRALSVLVGAYVLLFGIVGLVRTGSEPAFALQNTAALGLRTNFAFSLLSVVTGIAVILAVLIGRNLDRFVNLWGGIAFMVVGVATLAVINTPDLNKLNGSIATVIVSFVIGLVLFAAGLYGRTATSRAA